MHKYLYFKKILPISSVKYPLTFPEFEELSKINLKKKIFLTFGLRRPRVLRARPSLDKGAWRTGVWRRALRPPRDVFRSRDRELGLPVSVESTSKFFASHPPLRGWPTSSVVRWCPLRKERKKIHLQVYSKLFIYKFTVSYSFTGLQINPLNVITLGPTLTNNIYLKTIRRSLPTLPPSLGQLNLLTEGLFAVDVPFGSGSLLGSACRGQNVLWHHKTNEN